ncbi:hypothetical protein OL239_03485 [Arthrobacter sp. ATA002]|uniref:hypothetical protein n=1 Tax=Arthrobacter sp. ATA002 TaxID=2991715 RepID=UPI0022A7562E|nr:hypothetical protein [Arthrobacter sp. ATA002]WAP52355.1 hypothetical protein OL239_03485 [Arthrobacter sp. ATA002]
MTGLWVTALLGISALVLMPRAGLPAQSREPSTGPGQQSRGRTGRRQVRAGRIRLFRARPDPSLHEVPLLVHQLTGLLAAGRAPYQLWTDAAALQRSTGGTGSDGLLAARLLPVLEAAGQAASLGLSPVPVFRAAAEVRTRRARAAGRNPPGAGAARSGAAVLSMEQVWSELAGCVSISERSGAPLAGVLGRYAAQLEGSLDQQAARETALAGPKATVRLLTWLPVGGLGLGYLLGADPVGVLIGSPLGWLAAASGAALSLSAGVWSRALVRRAAAP